jgi:hypothetical protein
MSRLSSLLLLMLVAIPWLNAAKPLSPRAEISVLTIAPGAELYSAFGHTGIWVHDPLGSGVNTVYNYGTFDFQEGKLLEFYLNFVSGRLNYRLDVESFRRFEYVYHYYERSYSAQVLDLDQDQKQAVYDFLETNYLPENRYYLYEFFYDNCATRVRDLFQAVLGDTLRYHAAQEPLEVTFRDLLWEYLRHRRWVGFGIDLILGADVDRPITPWESMFLPDYLAVELGQAQLQLGEEAHPLVKETRDMYQGRPAIAGEPWYLRPWFALSLLLLAVGALTYQEWQRGQRWRGLDAALLLVSGLAGLVIFLLWFATIHTATVDNWNLLWLPPTHLVAGVLLARRQPPAWLQYYLWVSAGLTALPIVGWFFLPQAFNPAFLPWMLMLLTRCVWGARWLTAGTRLHIAD